MILHSKQIILFLRFKKESFKCDYPPERNFSQHKSRFHKKDSLTSSFTRLTE